MHACMHAAASSLFTRNNWVYYDTTGTILKAHLCETLNQLTLRTYRARTILNSSEQLIEHGSLTVYMHGSSDTARSYLNVHALNTILTKAVIKNLVLESCLEALLADYDIWGLRDPMIHLIL